MSVVTECMKHITCTLAYTGYLSVANGVYLFTSGVPDQTQDICCGYIEQATSGRGIRLHSILFNVDDYDADGAIPGRYANITRTAECLRNMAHCSHGRFHWFRETGQYILKIDTEILFQDLSSHQ